MSGPQNAEVESEQAELLQSALSSAFQNPSASRVVSGATSTPSIISSQVVDPPPETNVISSTVEAHETWKEEYDIQLQKWRDESAAARTKAEQERARWEKIRASEGSSISGDSWIGLSNDDEISGPPNPLFRKTVSPGSPSPVPADARDSVAGEGTGGHGVDVLEAVIPPAQGTSSSPHEEPTPSHSNLEDSRHASSHNWEEVPSMTSSFPSMSFPEERSNAPSPEPQPPSRRALSQPVQPASVPLASASLSVFDRSLTNRSRAWALVSSLTINLFLPFVNGVMLGFGEIVIGNILARFGLAVPGGLGMAVGIRSTQKRS